MFSPNFSQVCAAFGGFFNIFLLRAINISNNGEDLRRSLVLSHACFHTFHARFLIYGIMNEF